jgi:predicted flap endonuclease-1-like 5' DNA nuclease
MTYPIADIAGIGSEAASALKSVGIRTTARLLEEAKNPRGRQRLAQQIGFDEKRILRWANLVDRMRIKGVGEDYAELLRAAGVDTVKELKYRNPAKLAKAMKDANAKRKLVRVLPSDRAVERWIDSAKRLPLKISY